MVSVGVTDAVRGPRHLSTTPMQYFNRTTTLHSEQYSSPGFQFFMFRGR
jgi:hypothetical protein